MQVLSTLVTAFNIVKSESLPYQLWLHLFNMQQKELGDRTTPKNNLQDFLFTLTNPYATTFFDKSYASYFDMQRQPIASVHNYSPQEGVVLAKYQWT